MAVDTHTMFSFMPFVRDVAITNTYYSGNLQAILYFHRSRVSITHCHLNGIFRIVTAEHFL